MKLEYELIGSGVNKVVVMHDWFCDHSSYSPMIPYLNQEDFQYVFPDLRGYGLSKNLAGQYSIDECSQDILDTADNLGWDRFDLIGYSMTGLVGQNIIAEAPKRIKSLTAICPVPATGFVGADESFVQFLTEAATSDNAKALELANMVTSNRHEKQWSEFKVGRWRETTTVEARLGYLTMFLTTDIVDKVTGLSTPILVVCGSDDMEGLRKTALSSSFGLWYSKLETIEILNAGHCPMQEAPVSLADTINRSLLRTPQAAEIKV